MTKVLGVRCQGGDRSQSPRVGRVFCSFVPGSSLYSALLRLATTDCKSATLGLVLLVPAISQRFRHAVTVSGYGPIP